MDSIIKAKWIAALRSGKYKQGFGALNTHSNQHCCLGVLCEIMEDVEQRPTQVSPEQKDRFIGTTEYKYVKDEYILEPWFTTLPSCQMARDICLTVSEFDTLSMLNDAETSFEAIADYIEKHY